MESFWGKSCLIFRSVWFLEFEFWGSCVSVRALSLAWLALAFPVAPPWCCSPSTHSTPAVGSCSLGLLVTPRGGITPAVQMTPRLCTVMVFLPRSSCSWLLKGITPPRRPCRGPEWPGRGQHPRLGSTPCSLGPWASGTPSCCLIGEQERPECTPLRGCVETRSGPAGPPAQYRSVPPGRRPGPASAFWCLPSRDRLPSSRARGPNQSGAVSTHGLPPPPPPSWVIWVGVAWAWGLGYRGSIPWPEGDKNVTSGNLLCHLVAW